MSEGGGGPGATDGGSDRELVERVLTAGDERAFRTLFRRHNPSVYRFALRLTGGNEGEAEDAVQEAWVRAYRQLPGFEWRAALRTWICSITARCVSELRRKNRPAEQIRSEDGRARECGDAAVAVVEWVDLEAALARMPHGYRTVVVMAARGFTHEEIAGTLGISIGTSKSQLARGRRWLHNRMNG